MKLILSRKGFDAAAGGVASPIFEDGGMVSLPIPTAAFGRRYRDISFAGRNLGAVVTALTGRPMAGYPCHLDPDLDELALARPEGWKPAFGQVGAAQTHLANQGVAAGDLFLFCGWFREVSAEPWTYLRKSRDRHVLFGWLQVGEILAVGTNTGEALAAHPGLAGHPHLVDGRYSGNNTVYLATERLSIGGRDLGVAGAGVFRQYHDALCLTEPGAGRSVWRLPGWFLPQDEAPRLSYHGRPGAWRRNADGSCTLQTVGRGQEFVIDVTDCLEGASAWLETLVAGLVD